MSGPVVVSGDPAVPRDITHRRGAWTGSRNENTSPAWSIKDWFADGTLVRLSPPMPVRIICFVVLFHVNPASAPKAPELLNCTCVLLPAADALGDVAHVPSPRQKVVPDAAMPPFRCE